MKDPLGEPDPERARQTKPWLRVQRTVPRFMFCLLIPSWCLHGGKWFCVARILSTNSGVAWPTLPTPADSDIFVLPDTSGILRSARRAGIVVCSWPWPQRDYVEVRAQLGLWARITAW